MGTYRSAFLRRDALLKVLKYCRDHRHSRSKGTFEGQLLPIHGRSKTCPPRDTTSVIFGLDRGPSDPSPDPSCSVLSAFSVVDPRETVSGFNHRWLRGHRKPLYFKIVRVSRLGGEDVIWKVWKPAPRRIAAGISVRFMASSHVRF